MIDKETIGLNTAFASFQLPAKLDEIDTKGDLALDLALQGRLDGIAQTLVKHKVNVDRADALGLTLLHKAVKRGMFRIPPDTCSLVTVRVRSDQTSATLGRRRDTAVIENNKVAPEWVATPFASYPVCFCSFQ